MIYQSLRKLAVGIVAVGLGTAGIHATADEAGASLYERLGAWDGISQVVKDTIALHKQNPEIAHYFDGVDSEKLAAHVTAFFAAGTGGPSRYEGRDMTSTHASMGLSDADFDSAVADVLKACRENGVGETERAEVAAILDSLRPAVLGTAGS